jgi:A/G-specific adenine glycosylase
MNRNGNKPPWIAPLLGWFSQNQRAMPWRKNPSPYRVWVSEIMLQQTQVSGVIPYFNRFLSRFPNCAALAAAPVQDVLKAWEGLGYYTRAQNLHRAAGILVERHGGRLPKTFDALLDLPGVGRYTAAAIASIAFGQAVPVVDGNVLRVFARFLEFAGDIARPAAKDTFFAYLEKPIIASGDPSAFNQAIMELGALICTPRNPKCVACPIAPACKARRAGRQSELPMKAKKKHVPHETIGLGIVFDSRGNVLIARRKAGLLGGLWEFPGGKQEKNESLPDTVRREVLEETGLTVEVGKPLPAVSHAYSHFTVTLHPFICRRLAGRARALGSDEVRWVKPAALRDYPFPAANRKIEMALFSRDNGAAFPD